MTEDPAQYIFLNTLTNRQCKINTPAYRKGVKSGGIIPINQTNTSPKLEEPKVEVERKVSKEKVKIIKDESVLEDKDIQKQIIEVSSEIIKNNKKEFAKLDQEQTTNMLKKILYEKLFGISKEEVTLDKTKKSKPKKANKADIDIKFKKVKVARDSSTDTSSDDENWLPRRPKY